MSDTRAPDAPTPPDIDRRTLTPFGYVLCVVVPLLIAAAGFTFLHFMYDKEDLVDGSRLPLLTSDWRPGDDAMTAQLTGELTLEDGCVRLTGADGAQVDVVWPADFEATVQRVGSKDQLKVYDPDRNIAARGGNTVEVGGGMSDAEPYADQPCAPVSDEVFLVQSTVRVVGADQE
jgi:hypothetical protein